MIDDDALVRALLDAQIASAEQLAQAKMIQSQEPGLDLYRALLLNEIVVESPVIKLVAELLGVPSVDLDNYPFDPGITGMVSASMATRCQSLPLALRISREGEELQLAMVDPFDFEAMEEIAVHTGINIQPVLAGPLAMRRALTVAYPYASPKASGPSAKTGVGQEDSWALFFEDAGAEAPSLRSAQPVALTPSLGAEESAAIAQDMRDRPSSMEFDLLDLENDPKPPAQRTMYLDDEDVFELGPLLADEKPPAIKPPPIVPTPPKPPQDYAQIGSFFVNHDLRQSVAPEPANDADFFDAFFSEDALSAPPDAGDEDDDAPMKPIQDRFDSPPSRPSTPSGAFSFDEQSEQDEEELLLDQPAESPVSAHTSVASPKQLAALEPEPSPAQNADPVASAKNKLGQLRARLSGHPDEEAPSHTAVASPAMLGGLSPEKPAGEASKPVLQRLSLGKLGSSLPPRTDSTQVASQATLSAGLLKKAPAAPEPAAPALGKLQLKKVPAPRPAAVEEPPATRAFTPDAATREMTDADLFSFAPVNAVSPSPNEQLKPLALGPQSDEDEAMLEEQTRARQDSPNLSHTRPGPAPISGSSSTADRDAQHPASRETSANAVLTRAALMRMSRDTGALTAPKTPELPSDVSDRQLLLAALSILIEHGVLSLDELTERARKF
jgi:hypothetical protein